jgi:hypothetical protein
MGSQTEGMLCRELQVDPEPVRWSAMDFASDMFTLFGLYGLGIFLWIFALVWVWQDADEKFSNGWLWVICMLLFPLATFPLYLILRAVIYRGNSRQGGDALNQARNPHGWGWSLEDNPDRDRAGEYGRYDGNDGYTLNAPRPGAGFRPFQGTYSDSVEKLAQRHTGTTPKEDRHDWLE